MEVGAIGGWSGWEDAGSGYSYEGVYALGFKGKGKVKEKEKESAKIVARPSTSHANANTPKRARARAGVSKGIAITVERKATLRASA